MSTFLISCGGTGGHLSPGIALAEGLIAHGHRATLLISQKKVDARLIEKYPHLHFIRIPGAGFSSRPLGFLRFVASQTRGFWVSLKLVRRMKPAAVVGFGGFTSAAFIAAGAMLGVPVALHEANRVPGRAIRLLGRYAKRVYLPPGITLPRVRPMATRHVGLPVRSEIQRQPAAEARVALGLDPTQKVVVVFGGSQGATPLNDWARHEMPLLAADGIQLYCVTGMGKGEAGVQEFSGREGQTVRAIFTAFCDRVPTLLSAADVVISRAGAGTIAELIRTETPAILVPFPQAADNHQWANASYFEKEGGGLVIDQKHLADLYNKVREMLADEASLQACRANLRQMDRANALEFIVRDLEKLVAGDAADAHPERDAAAWPA